VWNLHAKNREHFDIEVKLSLLEEVVFFSDGLHPRSALLASDDET
jgi:hypothetical protein